MYSKQYLPLLSSLDLSTDPTVDLGTKSLENKACKTERHVLGVHCFVHGNTLVAI